MTKAEIRRIIKRLNNAAVCCHECGDKWGVYSVGCSSTWNGTCRVCGEEKPVTETRDYGYFSQLNITGHSQTSRMTMEKSEQHQTIEREHECPCPVTSPTGSL
jgi:hypothetical protein